MKYFLKFNKQFLKELEKIPSRFRKNIDVAIENLASDPRPNGYKKMKGHTNLYRVRVADYRIGYEIYDNTLIVVLIFAAHRREVYRDL